MLGSQKTLSAESTNTKEKTLPGFSSRHDIRRLVWFEAYEDPTNAIAREKEIKKWRRSWKIDLIEKENTDWKDLYPDIVR